jgi:SAM-dependent methyltransferase
MLFTELMLIRWSAAYELYLAYFTNFILLASFLGIGVGFLRSRAERDLFGWAPAALAGFVAMVSVLPVGVSITSSGRRFVGLFGLPALPEWAMLPLLFVGAVLVMALIGEGVARTFRMLPPLEAYRMDILGSLAGIGAFSGLSFLGLRPVVWGAVIATAFFILLRPGGWRLAVVAAIVILLGLGSLSPHDHWSPYYRVTEGSPTASGQIAIKANGLPHQSIVPLSVLRANDAFYLYPYRHLIGAPLDDVLVVGAGTGNDVAVALAMGARHVDAVEIDPVIWAIGRADNPDAPYQDPRVTSYIADGRAFLQRTDTRYNLIVFALPDSLTLVAGQSSLRLESYLFTIESMRSVLAHLAPGGAFTMYNYYRPDVLDRFAQTITDAFGHPPCLDTASPKLGPRQEAVLTIGRAASDITCATPWAARGSTPTVATDDHPFPYLEGRTIPRFYVVTLGLIIVGAVVIVRGAGGPLLQMRRCVDLFLMGAAFLLLETKNVVQFALLFGTTWFVNSLVFTGILVAILGAIEVVRRFRLPRPSVLFGLLLGALALTWSVPASALLGLPAWPRFAAAVSLAFLPVFLANLIFAQRFRDVGDSAEAFGANLLGAIVGGVLEYAALITGYRALLILVALLYAGAFVTLGGRPSEA